jgi:hypothetical protein
LSQPSRDGVTCYRIDPSSRSDRLQRHHGVR